MDALRIIRVLILDNKLQSNPPLPDLQMFLFKSTGNRKQVVKNPWSDISVEALSLSEFPSEQVEYNA